MSRISRRTVAISLVPIFGTYYGRALRWAVFLKPLKQKPSLGNLFSATVIGFAAITVFGRPGEFVRPYLIALKERVPVPSQMAAWILERMFDLLVNQSAYDAIAKGEDPRRIGEDWREPLEKFRQLRQKYLIYK